MRKTKYTRKFLGKTENFTDSVERHFYQRMLKAYLKGHTHFFFGFHNTQIATRERTRYEVAQKLIPIV